MHIEHSEATAVLAELADHLAHETLWLDKVLRQAQARPFSTEQWGRVLGVVAQRYRRLKAQCDTQTAKLHDLMKVPKSKGRPRAVIDPEYVRRLHEEGATVTQLAKRFYTSRKTIYRILAERSKPLEHWSSNSLIPDPLNDSL